MPSQREVTGSDEDIQRATNSLAETGFINYFGHQRFGSGCSGKRDNVKQQTSKLTMKFTGTHKVGIHLLKGEWDKAVEAIMSPKEVDMSIYR